MVGKGDLPHALGHHAAQLRRLRRPANAVQLGFGALYRQHQPTAVRQSVQIVFQIRRTVAAGLEPEPVRAALQQLVRHCRVGKADGQRIRIQRLPAGRGQSLPPRFSGPGMRFLSHLPEGFDSRSGQSRDSLPAQGVQGADRQKQAVRQLKCQVIRRFQRKGRVPQLA